VQSSARRTAHVAPWGPHLTRPLLLQDLYFDGLRPLEESFKFAEFFSPLLTPADFEAKPSVLMLGQYSTGKTTFIKSLLGRGYPGMLLWLTSYASPPAPLWQPHAAHVHADYRALLCCLTHVAHTTGANIGPEPTTDRFTVVVHGNDERRIPGNTLAVDPDHPYQSLQSFGTGFLARLEAAQCPCALLEHITLVDTPGARWGRARQAWRGVGES